MRHITGSHHKFPTGPGLVFVFSVFLSNIWVFPTMTSNILVNVCHKVTSQGLLINSQQARGLAAAANANQANQIPQFDDFQIKFHSLMIFKPSSTVWWFIIWILVDFLDRDNLGELFLVWKWNWDQNWHFLAVCERECWSLTTKHFPWQITKISSIPSETQSIPPLAATLFFS